MVLAITPDTLPYASPSFVVVTESVSLFPYESFVTIPSRPAAVSLDMKFAFSCFGPSL